MTRHAGKRALTEVSALALAALLAAANAALPAHASEIHRFDIAATEATSAIHDFAAQSGVQILAAADAVHGKRFNSVAGLHSTEEGLRILLAGTGLTHQYMGERAVALLGKAPRVASATRAGNSQTSESHDANGAEKQSFWSRFRLAQADQGTTAGGGTVERSGSAEGRPTHVEEVIVTAQKREERLQEVPIPVTTITAQSLIESNSLRLQDYYTRIPGLSVTPGIQSTQTLSIRGITTGFGTNPTVGITVDEVPYGSAAFLGGGAAVPDIDPSDLARVEVLRGPQGTLYGASSIGGLLKFVTVDPSTDKFSGRVQAGLSSIYNGDELGYTIRGSGNIPVSDTVAVRLSGFGRRDPGYIDDPTLGAEGVNSVDVYGGRFSTLWQISDAFSLKLGALLQRSEGDGTPTIDPALGDLAQARVPGTGWHDRKAEAYNATLTAELGAAELTSVSGYIINAFSESLDYGFIHSANAQRFFGVTGAELFADNETTKFSQEVRLVTPLGERVEWLLGAFYADEDADYEQTISALDAATGAPVGIIRSTVFPTTYEEYAAFIDLTFNFTDRFDVQIGGRQSWIDQTYIQTQVGPAAITPGTSALASSEAEAFTYLVTPRFRVSPDLMVYARFASGYRPGGPNADAGPGTPRQFDPDKTQNYEIGMKGNILGDALSFDASVFYIDWKDIQLLVTNPATLRAYNTNGSRAKSQGVELSVESRPADGLVIGSWVAWNDAELTENLPPTSTVVGREGDRLPNTSRLSGNLSVDQEFSVTGSMTAIAGGSVSYVGDRKGVLMGGAGIRQTFPSYTKVDLHAGLRHNSWTADFFVTNVTDKRGVLYGGLGAFPPTAFLYIQPRTIGLSVARSF